MSSNPSNEPRPASALDRAAILRALQALSDELGHQQVAGELCLFGGTVMVLAFAARVSTKDVDALFQPAAVIRKIADQIGRAQQLPKNWLNDGVKGFLSSNHAVTAGNLPQYPHLKLTMPVPEYLLAMKCMAARLGGTADEPTDLPDILFLIRRLEMKSAPQVLDLVAQYYPPNRIPVKTQYLIEGLFEESLV